MLKRLILAGLLITVVAGCAANSPEKRSQKLSAFISTLPSCAACAESNCVMEKPERSIQAPLAEPVPAAAAQPSPPVATIVISSNVLFAFDKAELKPDAIDLLKKLMADLSRYPNEQITVVGHADSIGKDKYNLELSQRRAQVVLDNLVSQGIQKQRLLAVGKGESEPKASNENASGRQLNRRVEVEMRLIK